MLFNVAGRKKTARKRAVVIIRSGSSPVNGHIAAEYEINGESLPVDWKAARELAQRS
ncbi:hypothetical protein [Rhodococcus qingshengii]|jgi:hypothetical protein|uniref:hypothetical protein n=1 Tax=Rhodococcus qingshengii TaxID=334542 RepID=UPI001E2FCEA0|nr:hypothetical protein [Rhodococcus qingshengii]UDF21583.1 hypothetical protein LE551_01485 [Rhodococcus qingshengii]